MTLLEQLAEIEARAREAGKLRQVHGHAYPIAEREFSAWMNKQTHVEATRDWRRKQGANK